MILSLYDKLIVGGVLIASVLVGLFVFGMHERTVGRENYMASVLAVQTEYKAKQKKVTTEVVTKYVDRIVTVKEKGDTIIKKVPVYVTVKDDSMCTVNNGFVRLWQAANQMSVPGSPGVSDGQPSEIVLSDIATQHAVESNICRQTEEQRDSLKEWIVKQSALR